MIPVSYQAVLVRKLEVRLRLQPHESPSLAEVVFGDVHTGALRDWLSEMFQRDGRAVVDTV